MSRELIERLEGENIRLRAALAQSEHPCVYCSLPADEWAKCQHGFPGCDRADDAMGCPELGTRLALKSTQSQNASLLERVRELEEALRPFAEAGDIIHWAASESDEIELSGEMLQDALRRARSVLNKADPNLAQEGKA